ncbi:MAG: WD40 repeat domain-containing serine/threonine protein kinase [Planctomycetota bacterium]
MSEERLEPGALLGGFRLVRKLGAGGMSVVWEAEQLSLRRRVALKLLLPHLGVSEAARERFEREGVAGGRLAHPGIVRTYEISSAGEWQFIVQELVDGARTLGDLLRERHERQQERTDAAEDYVGIAALFATIADALQAAHAAGVVHRDVKPGNILLTQAGEPKVADFGLARLVDDFKLSRTGELAGTPAYMSPEQAASQRIGIDHRTDVFSLGATLYEALTLRRPFDGDTSQQVIEQILLVDPPDPRALRSRVPRDLAVICMKALEKQRERRYQSMAELAADLRRFLAHESILARPPGPLARARKWTRRHPVVTAAGLVALAGLIGTSLLLAWALHEEEHAVEMFQEAARQTQRAERQAYAANLAAAQMALSLGDAQDARRRLAACAPEMRGWEWDHLMLQADNAVAVWDEDGLPVMCLAWSPDGQTIATIGRSGRFRLRDAGTGAIRLDVERLSAPLTAGSSAEQEAAFASINAHDIELVYSPDGKRLALRADRGALIDATNGRVVAMLPAAGHENDVVAFSPDGRLLAISNGRLSLIRAEDGQRMPLPASLPDGDDAEVACFLGPGLRLAVGAREGRVSVVDLATGALVGSTDAFVEDKPSALCASADGAQLGVGFMSGRVSLWEIAREARRPQDDLAGFEHEVNQLVFSPDGDRLIGDDFTRVRQWWLDSRDHDEFGNGFLGPPDAPRFSAATERVVLRSRNNLEIAAFAALSLEPVLSSRPIGVLAGHQGLITDHALSPDGRRLASSSLDGTVRVWDLDEPTIAARSLARAVPSWAVTMGALSRMAIDDGRGFLTADATGATNGIVAFPPGFTTGWSAFVAGDTRLVVERASTEDPAKRWLDVFDAESRKLVTSLEQPDQLRALEASRDGSWLAGGGFNRELKGHLQIWDTQDFVVRAHVELAHGMHSLALHPRGEFVAAGQEDGTILLWRFAPAAGDLMATATGSPPRDALEPLPSLPDTGGVVEALAFSPDGTLLAAGGRPASKGAGCDVTLWDTATWTLHARLVGHGSAIGSLAFNSDGSRLVSCSGAEEGLFGLEPAIDSSVRLWDPRAPAGIGELLVLREGGIPFRTAQFTPDGKSLFVTTDRPEREPWIAFSDKAQARATAQRWGR